MKSIHPVLAVRDEVFRKIGRNLVNFQMLEAAMKEFIPTLSVSGTKSTVQTDIENQSRKLRKATFGTLHDQLHRSLFRKDREDDESVPEMTVSEPFFRTSHKIELPDEWLRARTTMWNALVKERNQLVHGLLRDYDLDAAADCERLSANLDAQNSRIAAALTDLKGLSALVSNLRVVFTEWLESDEGRSTFAQFLSPDSEEVR